MARVPGFTKTFAGRWRIVEMDNLEQRLPRSCQRRCISPSGKPMAKSPLGLSRASWSALWHSRRIGLRRVLMGRARE